MNPSDEIKTIIKSAKAVNRQRQLLDKKLAILEDIKRMIIDASADPEFSFIPIRDKLWEYQELTKRNDMVIIFGEKDVWRDSFDQIKWAEKRLREHNFRGAMQYIQSLIDIHNGLKNRFR